MFLGDSRRIGGPGFLPLQDHGFNYYSSLTERASVLGVRVVNRIAETGMHIIEREAVGDMSGFMHWYRASRPIGGFREVWSASVEDAKSDQTGAPGDGGGPAGEVPPNSRTPFGPGGSAGGGGSSSGGSGTPFPGAPPSDMEQYPDIPVGPGVKPKSWKWPVWEGVPNPLGGSFPWPKFTGGGVAGGSRTDTIVYQDVTTAGGEWGDLGGDGGGGGGGGDGPGGGAKMPPQQAQGLTTDYNPNNEPVRPTSGYKWNPDKRYAPFYQSAPIDGSNQRAWNSFPRGYHGLMVASSDEIAQVEYFHPTDPRLLAPNYGGSPTHGTLVADVTDKNAVNVSLMAPLQSIFRVIPKPEGELVYEGGKHGNTLALNIGVSGLKDSIGGLFADKEGPDTYLGFISVRGGGPIDVGKCDTHKFATAGNSEICAGHISTQAFYRNAFDHDGPLAFEPLDWPDPGELPYKTKVHFVWNPGPKYMWPRDGGQKEAQGIWDWYSSAVNGAETPGTPTNPETGNPTTPGGEPGGGPTTPGGEVGGPTTPGGGDRGGDAGGGGGGGPTTGGGDAGGGPGTGGPGTGGAGGDNSNYTIYPGMSGNGRERSHATTHMESIFPSLLFRPQDNRAGQTDLMHKVNTFAYEVRQWQDNTPTTLRMQSFGARAGNDWNYTQRPKNSRNKGGTANGGIILLPPEVDGTDVSEGFTPNYVGNISSSSMVIGPGVDVSFSTIDATGEKTGGHNISYDKTNDITKVTDNNTGTAGLHFDGTDTNINGNLVINNGPNSTTIQTNAAAATTFNLPPDNGSSGNYLTTDGSGNTFWLPEYNQTMTIIKSPGAGDEATVYYSEGASTIQDIHVVFSGAGTDITWRLYHSTDRSSGTPNEVISGGITSTSKTTGEEYSTTDFDDATIPDGSWVWVVVDAKTGVLSELAVAVDYTYD